MCVYIYADRVVSKSLCERYRTRGEGELSGETKSVSLLNQQRFDTY